MACGRRTETLNYLIWALMAADEATNEAAEAIRKQNKRASGLKVENKLDALLRAEEAFSARNGSKEREPVCFKAQFSDLKMQ